MPHGAVTAAPLSLCLRARRFPVPRDVLEKEAVFACVATLIDCDVCCRRNWQEVDHRQSMVIPRLS